MRERGVQDTKVSNLSKQEENVVMSGIGADCGRNRSGWVGDQAFDFGTVRHPGQDVKDTVRDTSLVFEREIEWKV